MTDIYISVGSLEHFKEQQGNRINMFMRNVEKGLKINA